jgi:ABC-2 type transport system ATP-binding protein
VLRAGKLLYQGATRQLIDEHLDPRWQLHLSGPVDEVVDRLRQEPWVRRVQVVDGDRVEVEAVSVRAGERGIPQVVAACRAGLVACEPLAADLEAAFLALTRPAPPERVPAPIGATGNEERP